MAQSGKKERGKGLDPNSDGEVGRTPNNIDRGERQDEKNCLALLMGLGLSAEAELLEV